MRELWRLRRGLVGAVVLAHLPRGVEAEDVVQEVAALFVRGVGSIRDPGAFDPWIRRVAVNAARDAGRAARRSSGLVAGLTAGLALNGSVSGSSVGGAWAGSAAEAEEGRRLLELARELPEDYREPLLLRCVRGLSYRAIAHAMELPETTVETRIVRARRMLRTLAIERAGTQEVRP
ncbi:MAG: sigma-70 family RNA polymerase sigma factor [Phycisphaerales bacterium]|nr:sigma-70 family RNA polymerase sigma factor [Phycisphaerales bacterium]